MKYIKRNTRDSVSPGYQIIEKRVENTTRSGVVLTRFEVSDADETLSGVFFNAEES